MNKQRRIWISVAVLAAVSLATLVTLNRSREPRYKGRTVTEWMSDVNLGSNISTNRQIRLMLAELGSNAVPALMAELTVDDSPLSQLMRRISTSSLPPSFAKTWAGTNLARMTSRILMAAQALELLGPKASPATVQLERLVCEKSLAGGRAVSVLEKIGQNAVPSLIRSLTTAPPFRRIFIVASLEKIFRGIEEAEFPLIDLLDDPDKRTRITVALALSNLSTPPREAIPVLAEALGIQQEGYWRAYWQKAIRALEIYAPAHPEALVAIQDASKSVDESLRLEAQASLWRIDWRIDYYKVRAAPQTTAAKTN